MQNRVLAGENLELAAATLSCIVDGVISTDLNRIIIYINRIAETIIEIEGSQTIGKDFDSILSFYNTDTNTRPKSPLSDVIHNVYIAGLGENIVLVLNSNIKKNISAAFSPGKTIHGTIISAVMIFRDITNFRTTELQLKESEKKFLELFHSSSDLIFVHEIGIIEVFGKLMEANETACRIMGFSLKELQSLKKPPFILNNPNKSLREYFDILMNDCYLNFEATFKTKNGSLIPVDVTARTFSLNGKIVMLTVAHDFSHRKEGMLDLTLKTLLNDEQKDNLLITKNCTEILLKIINEITRNYLKKGGLG